jgi:hypothetical protein
MKGPILAEPDVASTVPNSPRHGYKVPHFGFRRSVALPYWSRLLAPIPYRAEEATMATILSSSETSVDRLSHVIDPADIELPKTQPIEIILQPNLLVSPRK